VAKKDTARIAVSDGPKLVQRPSVSLPKHMNRFYKFFLSLCVPKKWNTRNALRGQNGKTAILIEILAVIRCIEATILMDGDEI